VKNIIARLLVASVIFGGSALVVGCGDTPPAKPESKPSTGTPKAPEKDKAEKKDK